MTDTSDNFVRIAIAKHEVEAEMMCQLLRSDGIECFHSLSNFAVAGSEGAPGGLGARQVMVRDTDVERARELLAATSDEGEST